jgi:uncharacterized membrane protein YqgA involved in biofilm formation
MEAISSSTPIQLGLVITIFGVVIGGLFRIDKRFNTLEAQVKTALRGRMTRQEHQIWALQLQVRNKDLRVPMAGEVEQTDDYEPTE